MDLSPHPQSLSDPIARVFESNGHIFRGISPAHVRFYEQLLDSPIMGRLLSLGLVTTERSDRSVNGHPLVLKHQRVDFVSDWREWPSLMLRDAAIMVCDIWLELLRHNYGMLDIHPWNVLFDFSRPVFIDFAAVVPLNEVCLNELAGRFRNYWILPLTFISMGHPHFARSIRKSPEVTDPIDDFLKRSELRWFPWWYYRLQRSVRNRPLKFFKGLREHLEELSLPMSRVERSCCGKHQSDHDEPEHYDAKARVVHSLLDQLKSKSLLDIGCGDGRYSMLAERMGAKVVAFDKDEVCVNALYRDARSHRLNILPLLLDFTIPTHAHGRKKEFPPATERLACETSLMLALIHYLVFDLDLSFERVANLLSAYTTEYSIVEFVPPEDKYVAERMSPHYQWYRLENFIKAMKRHFQLTGVFESHSPRKILLFQKQQ